MAIETSILENDCLSNDFKARTGKTILCDEMLLFVFLDEGKLKIIKFQIKHMTPLLDECLRLRSEEGFVFSMWLLLDHPIFYLDV